MMSLKGAICGASERGLTGRAWRLEELRRDLERVMPAPAPFRVEILDPEMLEHCGDQLFSAGPSASVKFNKVRRRAEICCALIADDGAAGEMRFDIGQPREKL